MNTISPPPPLYRTRVSLLCLRSRLQSLTRVIITLVFFFGGGGRRPYLCSSRICSAPSWHSWFMTFLVMQFYPSCLLLSLQHFVLRQHPSMKIWGHVMKKKYHMTPYLFKRSRVFFKSITQYHLFINLTLLKCKDSYIPLLKVEEYSCSEQCHSNFSSEIGRQPVEFVAATKSDK
jgi:hypothetical protein